ncbi:hypothetical protein [Pseudorhodoferax sp.]|uniref:hypothetical protein n=1 Tax=Pseudorhodoferax sp. TaxID=1993553 RepID=UPI0039E72379
MADTPSKDEAAALQLENLRHELLSLRRPFWRDPKAVGAVIAFLASFAVNIGQYISASKESIRKDRELTLKSEQWTSQKQQLELEVQRLRQQVQTSEQQARRAQVDIEELAKVKKDIGTWEAAVAESELKIANMRNSIPQFEKEGRKNRAEAERANLALQEGLLTMQQAELQKSTVRRAELEALLK